MPHQCVKCSTFYEDGADELLKGCPCGGKLFFYVKESSLKKKKDLKKLSKTERKQIEKDVLEIVGENKEDDNPVILDLESINISEPGKYEIDLVHIFKGSPLIYKVEEGKYVIDLPSTFLLNKEDKDGH